MTDKPFRYLSPEPAPHELGIPADAVGELDCRTALEIFADTPLLRQSRAAAERVKQWSPAKQDYAARVTRRGGP